MTKRQDRSSEEYVQCLSEVEGTPNAWQHNLPTLGMKIW